MQEILVGGAQDKALLFDLLAKRRPHLADLWFSLPLPPSVNAMYADIQFIRPDGTAAIRRVASAALRQFKEDVATRLRYLYRIEPGCWAQATEIGYQGAILVTTWRPDLDNRLKATADAVTRFLGVNDNRVVEMHVVKIVDKYQLGRILLRFYILKYAARNVAGRKKGLQYV